MSKKGGAVKAKEEATYEFRDIVLAKLRGFPAWPAQIVDPDTVGKDVLKERPLGKKSSFYCVRFFPIGDHAWLQAKDLSKLQLHEIQAYINEPHKRNGDLLEGYRVALDPGAWEEKQKEARERAEELNENEPVDELDEDGEGADEDDDEMEKANKRKRKRESKPKEKPAKDTKQPKSKRKAGGKKSSAMVESEDEGGDAGPSSKNKDPPPPYKKNKHSKDEKEANGGDDVELDNDPEALKVKDMRHKLQRAFLSKTGPKADDMTNLDKLFSDVEEYKMTIQYLQYSKIGKVMRHIAALDVDKVPREDEFKFRERAQALVNKWHNTVNSQGGDQKAAVNGSSKANGAPAPDTAGSEGIAPLTAGADGAAGVNTGDMTMDTTLGDVTMMTDVTA